MSERRSTPTLVPRTAPVDLAAHELPVATPFLLDLRVAPDLAHELVDHVPNDEVVRWLDAAAEAHATAAGMSRAVLLERGLMWFVARHEIDYRAEVHAGDELVVATWVRDMARVKSWREYAIVRPSDDRLVCRAATLWVLVSLESRRPTRIPAEFRAVLPPADPAAARGSAVHVALIMDEERLGHEHATLNRLCIGLIGEGVRVTRVVPESTWSGDIEAGEQRVALATRVTTAMRVVPWRRGDRRARLVEAMERRPPDVLYAVGNLAWPLGLDLARALNKPLAIDLWSAGQIRKVPRGRRAATVGGYIAPTEPIAGALRQRVEPDLVCLVPIGVAVPPEPRRVLADPDNAIAIAILGGGRDVNAYQALLGGLSRVIRRMPQVQAFLELDGPNEHEIWRYAQRLDLMHNVSAITRASRHRSLLTRCDLFVMPEQFGEVRSIMLEAMTYGLPIVTSDDPYLDMLVDGETATVVGSADAEAWGRALTRLLTEPDAARAMGLAGRERVAARHRSSDQIERLIEAFERLASGGPYRFARGGA